MIAHRLDLKLRLALQIAAMTVLCLAVATAYVLLDVARAGEAQVGRVAELVARDLNLQQGQMHWVRGVRTAFPDLQRVAPVLMVPGLCIAYRGEGGEIVQRLCSGAAPEEAGAPGAFARMYVTLFGAGREAARPVEYGGEVHGEAVASLDPQSLIGTAWREAGRLVAVMAATLCALCLLVYAALANALQPTRIIQAGLRRLAAGDLSARMPAFDLAELSAVGAVFNQLAARLEETLAERNALTRQLIAVQDEERRFLARELHDEFGQSLAAIGAVAALAGQKAERDCPALVAECQSIARTAQGMMAVLRGALLRLRPPDVEELGLAASLEGLVSGWNGRMGGRTRFSISIDGSFDGLPLEFAASLYRIAQEAITNAAKHASASRVTLSLAHDEGVGAAGVVLTVEDDGCGGADAATRSGLGLLGMRERVGSLGGTLAFGNGEGGGLLLRARIPLPRQGASLDDERRAA